MKSQKAITGTVTYRERMALPPGAIVVVRLEDVSKADAPSTVLAEERIEPGGKQVPIPFKLDYDPSAVSSRGRYNVRAEIFVGDKLWFASASAHPVLNDGAGNQVDILLSRVEGIANAPSNPPAASPSASLLNTHWSLVEINGQPLIVGEFSQREPHFVLEAEEQRFYGSGGVNRILGAYKLEGEKLSFSPGPTTLMAGPPELMKQEEQFFSGLKSVTRFEVNGQRLTLFAEDRLVMTLQASSPK